MTILAGIFIFGCAGPGYYYQAASGHLELMRARQDIAQVIVDPDTDPGLARQLQTAREILEFANSNLGLPAGDSYESYVETGRDAVVWNVVATPEFSLEARKWCFPVAGCVPYRGYFDQEKAGKLAKKLRKKGLDVSVTAATAYSTLGWFDDPLLDTMLNGPETQLAATIFHELAHARLYVSGDTAFNESYAGFVAHTGVESWLANETDSRPAKAWRDSREALRDFHALLSETRKSLSELYRSGLPEEEMRLSKATVFEGLRTDYAVIKEQNWQGRDYFSGWFSSDIGNAQLALFQSYEGGICAFTRLFSQAGEDIIEFHRLAAQQADQDRAQRLSWVLESCQPIASSHDL